MIATDTARWNLETTFQELRAWLGLETSRGWSRATVLRMAPCLFGLYTAVALLYQARPEEKRTGRPGGGGGEVGCDVLRRADGGAAMAVAGVGIPIGR